MQGTNFLMNADPNEILAFAIRVEDAMNCMNRMLDGAEATQGDYKRDTAIMLARAHAKNLDHVVKRLREIVSDHHLE